MEVKMEKLDFEKSMEKLEKIVQDLEKGDLNLEDSIKKFEQGMELSKKCNEILQDAEKRITVLLKTEDGLQEEDF